jgi:hypothetical protein
MQQKGLNYNWVGLIISNDVKDSFRLNASG